MRYEGVIRLVFFLGILGVMAAWEAYAPRRKPMLSKVRRWSGNLGIVVLNAAVLRVVLPMGAVGVAALAQDRGWGVLSTGSIPDGIAWLSAVVAMDFAIYLQHAMFHSLPVLWRLHRVHHVDLDFDVTTGIRFHPLEIILSMLIKFGVIVLLGAPPSAVVVFEVLLNGTAMFNHGNVHIPTALDRVLRWLVVTPDMHRVHHSVYDAETNSNFGFNLPWWDRICGTYLAQPRDGHEQMRIGIRPFQDPKQCNRLTGMLALPFTRPVTGYAVNRRRFDGPGH